MTRGLRRVYPSGMVPMDHPSGGIEQRVPELLALCRRHRVRRLDLFGSAARGQDFDPARSDLDLLVEFEEGATPSAFDFLALRDELSALLGVRVDLSMGSAIRNPYVRASIEADRRPLLEA